MCPWHLSKKKAFRGGGRRRTLTLETLEVREMLSVSPLPWVAEPDYELRSVIADTQKTTQLSPTELQTRAATPVPDAATNDPDAARQWAFDAIDAEAAWDISDGAGVVVAVLDSGIALTHPDLKPNIWVNTAEIAGDGIDNDGNGYIDDINGWNFAGDSASGNVSGNANVKDNDGHGTHVAGIIGAVANNGIGVAGAASGVKILPLKVIEGANGSTTAIVAALDYLINLKARGVNVAVANMSLGYLSEDPAVGEAIRRAGAAGVVVVASAGNNGANNDSIPHFPSAYSSDMSHVISVAAIDQTGQLAGNSNYGQNSVDVAAPGVSIYSTTYDGKYGLMSGTSMAAPLVSATAAILAANDAELSPAGIKARILEAATPSTALAGKVATGGILNMGRIFVTAANDPPIPPSKLHILVVDNGHVTLEWQDNSTNETGFELQVSTDGGVTWTNLATTPGNQVTRTIEFSANTAENTVARFRVRAANDFGVSSWAAVASTPSDAPKKPSVPNGGKAQASSAQEIVVTWNPAAQATAYRVERALSAKGEWQEVYLGSKTSFADNHGGEGLASSTKYFYRVTAINLSVSSKTSGTFSATTSALPPEGMPDAVEATAESTSRVHVTWKAVNHATQYLVERSTDGATWKKVKTVSIKSPNDLTEAIISGHKPATSYFYRVTASSPAGSSEPSAAVSVTTLLKTPSAPRLTVLGSQSVQLKWVGEKNVAGYRIDRVAENSTVWETIVELDAATKEYLDTTTLPNTVYQYRLVSLGNGVNGENIESHPSRVRKIQTAPPRVERLEAIAVGPRQVTLTWSEAAGATRYLVQHFNGKVWRNAGTTKTTSITVRSLSADSVHRFRVVAVGKDGNADSSSELEIVTPIDVPKTPNALRLFASGPYSATLTWKEAEGADFYRIYRYDTEERNWDMQADEITELAYHDEYLEEKTRYQYRVFAVNASGESLRFASGSVVTLQEPTLALFPDSPEIVSVTKSSVRIAFTAPEAGRQIYRIQWSADGEIWLSEKMYASTQGAVVVSMLRPNTEYFFRIRLEKMNRISDWSPVIYATTLSLFESQKPLPVG